MNQQVEEKNKTMDGEIKGENLPPGFRFHPSDEELVGYYLVRKLSDSAFTARAVADVDLNKCEPWELPGKAKMGDKEWYFFSLRDRKYPTGVRTNRATNNGYWKTTGKDKEIIDSETSEFVGMKKTLVFYRGRAPRGEKTNWIMHEYRIHSKSSFKTINQEEWVVCRIFQKSENTKKFLSEHSRGVNSHKTETSSNGNAAFLCGGDVCQFPYRIRNADVAEMTRAFMPTTVNVPVTVSGLNLNLGGGLVTSQPLVVMGHQNFNSHVGSGEGGSYAGGTTHGPTFPGYRFFAGDYSFGSENFWPSY